MKNYIEYKTIYILGNGGLSSSVKAKSKEMGFYIVRNLLNSSLILPLIQCLNAVELLQLHWLSHRSMQ